MKPAASAALSRSASAMHHRLRAGRSIERLYRNARLKPALEERPTVQYVTIVPDMLAQQPLAQTSGAWMRVADGRHSMTVLAIVGGSRPARIHPAAVAASGTPISASPR